MTPRISGWLVPGGLAALCVLAMAPGAFEALRYERALIGAEPWRLVTAHLVHLGWTHLALNLAGLAAMWALLGDHLRTVTWLYMLFACALGVGAGLWLGNANLEWYAGLSGVLHGMFVAGAAAGLRRAPLFHGMLLAGVLAKVAWEQLVRADVGSSQLIGGAVIVDAHLYGLLAGLALALLAWRAAVENGG